MKRITTDVKCLVNTGLERYIKEDRLQVHQSRSRMTSFGGGAKYTPLKQVN